MATVELRTLGDCQILIGDARLGPQSPHAFAVALYLCIERGRPHSRDELHALFFPGVADANASHSLRQVIYKLRVLGLPCTTEAAGTLVAACDVRDDYSALLATGQLPAVAASPLPGTFLPGYWPRISDDYTRWLEAHRDAINGALRRAYVSRVIDRRAVARWDQVELYARACLQIDPLNEEATLALAESLALSGSKAAGVKVLERYIQEVGVADETLRIPATILRKRISERLSVNPARAAEPALVGREAELRLLATALAESRTGASQAVHISGEAGIGKTRLIREFLTSALLNGAQSIELGAQPHDLRRPLSTIAELASLLLRANGAIGAAPGAIATLRRLVNVDPGDSDGMPAITSPAEMEARLAGALTDLVDAITRERSLIVAVEDVHWADSASRRVIDAILSDRRPRRLLWLLMSRGVSGDTLARAAGVPLRGLDRAESAHFVARYLETRIANPTPALAETILRLGGGNPFYLRSLCDYYADHGDYESTPPLLRDIVLQRVRALDTRARTVLAMCAVLGRYATTERLQATLEMPCHELTAVLADLEVEGLLRLRDGLLMLQHDLLSAAVLDETPDIARAVMRRAVAQRLEREGEASGELSLLWQAADHWTACGEPGRAKELFRECALHASSMGLVAESFNALIRYTAVATEEEALELMTTACSTIQFEIRDPDTAIRDWQASVGRDANTELATAFELTIIDSNYHFRADSELHLEHVMSLVQDHRLSQTLRNSAASIAMRIADDFDDIGLALRIANEMQLADANITERDDPHFARLYLLYHTQFGSDRKAVATALNILSWPSSVFAVSQNLRSLANAGIALGFLGQFDAAWRGFERMLSFPLTSLQRNLVLAHMAWTKRHAGDKLGEETYSIELERQYATGPDAKELDSGSLYYLTRRAIDRSEHDLAANLLTVLCSRMVPASKAAHWAMLEALKLRVATALEPASIDRETVAAVADWSLRTACRGAEDDVALAVTNAYATYSLADARLYLRQYYRFRRECLPVLPLLRQAEAALTAVE